MATINAAAVFQSLMAAAINAPTEREAGAANCQRSEAARYLRSIESSTPHGLELEHHQAHDVTHYSGATWTDANIADTHRAAVCSMAAAAYAELMTGINAPEKVAIQTGERSRVKLVNTRERLQAFAEHVRKHQALYGGGIARTAKPRAAVTWPAASVRLVAELIQDGDYRAAVTLADEKCGAGFYHMKAGPNAFMTWAPQPVEGMPDGFITARRSIDGKWVCMHQAAGYSMAEATSRAAAERDGLKAWEFVGEAKQAAALARCAATPHDQAAARAAYMEQHNISETSTEAAPLVAIVSELTGATIANVSQYVADQLDQMGATRPADEDHAAAAVADLVASATAAAAIEQASEATQDAQHQAPELATADCEAADVATTCEDASSARHGATLQHGSTSSTTRADTVSTSTSSHAAPRAPAADALANPPSHQAPAADPAPAATQPQHVTAAAFVADVPRDLAARAYCGTSFNPERRGDSARSEYAQTLAEDYATLYAAAVKGGTLAQLPAEFARYRGRMASRYNAYLVSSSRCVSSFIAGPSNFPAHRMNKRADIAHARLNEYLDGRAASMRAAVRNLRPDLRPIMSGDADAAERLARQIDHAERVQARMVAANKAIRAHAKAGAPAQVAALMELGFKEGQAAECLKPDYAGRVGFPSYALTNNSANIRRMRERLQTIEQNHAAPVVELTGADGVRLEDDPPANRIRLYFAGKPAADIRADLKAAGFRWAPSIGAWQAFRNHRTISKAHAIAETTPADLAPAHDEAAPADPAPAAPTPADLAPAPADPAGYAPAAPDAGQQTAPVPSAADEVPQDLDAGADDATSSAPADPRADARKHAQAITPKNHAWRAWFYLDDAGRPCTEFEGPDGCQQKRTYTNGRERMQDLQTMARQAADMAAGYHDSSDGAEDDTTDGQPVDAMAATVDQVQAWPADRLAAVLDYLEDINHHGEALLIRTLHAGRADLAARARDNIRAHLAAGHLTPALSEERRAIDAELRHGAPTPTDPAPTPPAARAADLAGYAPAAPDAGQQTAPVPNAADEVPQDLDAGAPFQRARPVSVDLRALMEIGADTAFFVGLGVVYRGDMANADGTGAIVAAELDHVHGLQVSIQLEDGRNMKTSARSFGDHPGARYQLDQRRHGAPYLAQLAAAVASANAARTSAKETADKAHARALVDLAAQFPQLQRADTMPHAGGKLAAINIRKLLKEAFKGVKFSVTSDYNSVRIGWTDGPTADQVRAIVGRFDIGASDLQTDYFYTISTAFSELFGGVQYMSLNREFSDDLINRALLTWWPEPAGRPSAQDWRQARGVFSYAAPGDPLQQFRQHLAAMDAR